VQVLLFYPDGKRSSSTEGQVNQGGGAAIIAAQPHFPGNEAQMAAGGAQEGQAALPPPPGPGGVQGQPGDARGGCPNTLLDPPRGDNIVRRSAIPTLPMNTDLSVNLGRA
jgi:hypothetical protein